MSFLEMLDVVNEGLIKQGEDPIAFDSDCREGICGTCGCMVNGVAHGPDAGTTVCQLHMRRFKDGDTIVIEPWRARAFPILKDLVVDRSAFDRIIQAGGYTSINVGSAPDGNAILVAEGGRPTRRWTPRSASAAAPASPRARTPRRRCSPPPRSSHLALLPQGQPERLTRVRAMVERMDAEGFGACSNEGECEAVCPKEHLDRRHRPHEPRVHAGGPQRRRRQEDGRRIRRLCHRPIPNAGATDSRPVDTGPIDRAMRSMHPRRAGRAVSVASGSALAPAGDGFLSACRGSHDAAAKARVDAVQAAAAAAAERQRADASAPSYRPPRSWSPRSTSPLRRPIGALMALRGASVFTRTTSASRARVAQPSRARLHDQPCATADASRGPARDVLAFYAQPPPERRSTSTSSIVS